MKKKQKKFQMLMSLLNPLNPVFLSHLIPLPVLPGTNLTMF